MTTEKQEFTALLRAFDTAMLVSRASDGTIRARPMAIADAEADGDLWFATDSQSAKVDELTSDDHVAATFQDGKRFLSVSGRAELVHDRRKVYDLWKPAWQAWFPEGKDDPRVVLVHLRAEEAEYWDQSGVRGLRYAFEAAKAVLKGERVQDIGKEQHGKLRP